MSSKIMVDVATQDQEEATWRLFIAWQEPVVRAITPVGRLDRIRHNGEPIYSFTYLKSAETLPTFRPFVNFPDLHTRYTSPQLFPFFENRLMPRKRADYSDYLQTLALSADADPFEVLARSGGRKATDTVEVFPEPIQRNGYAETRFLSRVKHIPHAVEDVSQLARGTRLFVLHDMQNDYDELALMVRTGDNRLAGFVPAYLAPVIHHSMEQFGRDAVTVKVEHVGDSHAPLHMRLLCHLRFEWERGRPCFQGPEYEPLSEEHLSTP